MEVFNKGILERCLKLYSERLQKLHLPILEQTLVEYHESSMAEAMKLFEEQHFGRNHAKKSVMQLEEEIDKVFTLFIIILLMSIRPYPPLVVCLFSALNHHAESIHLK